MPKTIISVDITKGPKDQPTPIHNRWHPDIPPVATVRPGEDFIVECLDWTGGQIHNDDNAADIRDCDLFPCHHLFGPIEVVGAEPGDILVVDVLDIGPLGATSGATPASSRRRTGAAFLLTCSPRRGKRSGTPAASMRARATSPK